jgi:hypothetical protein
MSKGSSPWTRELMIALICAIALPVVIIAGWGLKWTWAMRQHDNHMQACFAEFARNTPGEWTAIAQACQAYWMAAREAETSKASQLPLPSLLAKLQPVYHEVRKDELYLSWTGGFDNNTLLLEYDTTEGKRTLWLVSTMGDAYERAVWSELNPPPASRARK